MSLVPRLTLLVYLTLGLASEPAGVTSTCQTTHIVAAKVVGNDTILYVSTVSSPVLNFTLTISGHVLPTRECGHDYGLCGILVVRRGIELLVILPSQGGFVMVTYQQLEDHPLNYTFYPIDLNCHPVKPFYNYEKNKVLFECLNIVSETDGTFYVVEFDLDQKTFRYSQSQTLQRPSDLSYAVYAQHKIFFVENRQFLYVESQTFDPLELSTAFQMPKCDHVHHIELLGDELAYVYCSNQATRIVTIHLFQVQEKINGAYIFPCVGSNEDVHIIDGTLMLNKTGAINLTVINLSTSEVVYGLCFGNGSALTFWGQTVDGRLFSVDLAGDEHVITDMSQCTGDDTCLQPVTDTSKTFGVYYDTNTSLAHLVNFTSSCGHANVSIPFRPDLLLTAVGVNEYSCVCINSPTESQPSSTLGTIAGVVFAVVVVVMVAVVTLILSCVYVKKKQPRKNMPLEENSLYSETEVNALPIDEQQNGKSDVVSPSVRGHPSENISPSTVATLVVRQNSEDARNHHTRIVGQN